MSDREEFEKIARQVVSEHGAHLASALAASDYHGGNLVALIQLAAPAIYRAGRAAALEEAAKECDRLAKHLHPGPAACAAAIRALQATAAREQK